MSVTLMVEIRCSGHDSEHGRWLIEFERPVMLPALPPVGTIMCLEQGDMDSVTPDEVTITEIWFIEGEDFFRCHIDQSGWPDETVHWEEFVRLAEKYGWRRVG